MMSTFLTNHALTTYKFPENFLGIASTRNPYKHLQDPLMQGLTTSLVTSCGHLFMRQSIVTVLYVAISTSRQI
jgi:hypothetical protein